MLKRRLCELEELDAGLEVIFVNQQVTRTIPRAMEALALESSLAS